MKELNFFLITNPPWRTWRLGGELAASHIQSIPVILVVPGIFCVLSEKMIEPPRRQERQGMKELNFFSSQIHLGELGALAVNSHFALELKMHSRREGATSMGANAVYNALGES